VIQEMFSEREEHAEMARLLDSWKEDPGDVKQAFIKLRDALSDILLKEAPPYFKRPSSIPIFSRR